MKQTYRAQQGFTLIELMIVVAIIGILAAIALPAYQDYVGRAQASEGLTATSGIRADMGIYLAENGDLPDDGDDTQIDDALASLEGQYFGAGGAILTDPGVITITFNAGVHSGDNMTLTATAPVDADGELTGQISGWVCDGLDTKFLPSACRP